MIFFVFVLFFLMIFFFFFFANYSVRYVCFLSCLLFNIS